MVKSDRAKMYAQEYIIDFDQQAAAIRAGYSPKSARMQASRLMARDDIQKLIQQAMTERQQRTNITADMVLQRWWDIASADPNDIIHLRRVCCRHCYGVDHEYQWLDKKEYKQAVHRAKVTAMEQDKAPQIPSDAGGYGFDRLADPSNKCPYCRGEGVSELHVEDTRKLSKKAKLLYAGIKQTQAGIEIKFQDQGKALENVARHLGMFIDKHEHTGANGGPMQVDLSGLTIEELKNLAKLDRGKTGGDS